MTKLADIKLTFSEFPVHPELSPGQTKRIKDVLTWLIFRHPRQYRLTASRLMKLYYMAELRAIETLGKPLSGAQFVNWNHGPWSQAVAMVADGVHPDFGMEPGKTPDGYKAKFYKAKVPNTWVDLEPEETKILDEVIDEWVPHKTNDLVKATKETDPFRATKYGEVIDLAEYARCWADLKSKAAREEIDRNLAAAKAGKGKRVRNALQLRALVSDL